MRWCREERTMRMEIRGRNLWLTPALLDHVDRRVRDALGRYRARVRRVTVRLFDSNGDDGGTNGCARSEAAPGPRERCRDDALEQSAEDDLLPRAALDARGRRWRGA